MQRFLALGTIFLACAIGTAAAQTEPVQLGVATETLQDRSGAPSTEFTVALVYRADALRNAILVGNDQVIQNTIQEIDVLAKNYGAYDLTPLVEAMCIWARELSGDGSPEIAKRTLDTISHWAPYHPSIQSTEVVLKRQGGLYGYLQSLVPTLNLSQTRLENTDSKYIFIFQHLVWIRFVATAVLWLLALTLTLRYYSYFRGLLEKPLAMAFRNSHAKACLSAIILVSPIIIGLDPSYTAFLWILLLAPILTPIELRIAACCIAIQIIHPCILLAENHFSVKESPLSIVSLQKQPQLISLNARGLEKLSQHDQLFMVGWEALHSNDWERAENIFRTLSALPHESCATLNNLGVALHRQQKTHDAKAAFVKARNANSGAIEPIYNQAIIDFAALDYVEGEKKLLEAKKINLQEYNRITNSMMFFNRQPTFAMPIPDTHERINALTHSYNNFYNGSFDMMNINNQSNTSFIWIIWPLLGATAIVLRRFKSGALYRPFLCNNCGEIVWETPHFGQNICHQCQSLQASKGASHISGRTKKLRQIHKFKVFQRRITWLFRAILPGCDRILHGSTLVGFGILLVTVTAAGLIFQSPNNTLYPSETIPDPPSTFMVIGGLLAFIMYLQSWLKPRSNR